MIKRVEGFEKHVAISGFRDVQIIDVDHFLKLTREKSGDGAVQFFDAESVAGWQHLYFAALNALKAFKNGTNISKNLAIECLLYASARRQIRAALDLVGIRRNSSKIAMLAIADEKSVAEESLANISKLIPGRRDDSVLDLSNGKIMHVRRLFKISDTELAAKLEKNGEKKILKRMTLSCT